MCGLTTAHCAAADAAVKPKEGGGDVALESREINLKVLREAGDGRPYLLELCHRPTGMSAMGEDDDFDQAKRDAMAKLEKIVSER